MVLPITGKVMEGCDLDAGSSNAEPILAVTPPLKKVKLKTVRANITLQNALRHVREFMPLTMESVVQSLLQLGVDSDGRDVVLFECPCMPDNGRQHGQIMLRQKKSVTRHVESQSHKACKLP